MEKILFLHLTLSGYPVNKLTVQFNKNRPLNPKEESEAKKTEIENVLLKMNAGLIDKDTAARELGYEKASGNTTSGKGNLSEFSLCDCGEKKKSTD